MCVLALKSLEVSSKDPVVERALAWIGGLFSVNGRGNWHDEPWETSWALMAILATGRIPAAVDIESALRWLVHHQAADGLIIAPHYTAYFLLIAHHARKARLSEDCSQVVDHAAAKCGTYLVSALKESDPARLWTGEAWSNGQILWALSVHNLFPADDNALVAKVVEWFGREQTADGNWSDVEDTASAILGLFALLSAITQRSSGAISASRVERDIEEHLRRAVVPPRLQLSRKLFERDQQSGYISLNIPERTWKLLLGILLFLVVGLVGWLADILSLIQSLHASH